MPTPPAFASIPADLTDHLNDRQREAVTTLTGPLLVVAGPGSGKTSVLTHRIAALVATGIQPWQILAVTFTNKAAKEMRDRVAGLLGDDLAKDMWVTTFHSACVRILRYAHAEAGLPRSFAIVDADDAKRLVKKALEETGHAADAAEVKAARNAISRTKNAGLTAQHLAADPDPQAAVWARAMTAYNNHLTACGAVDFDDLLIKALDVLQRHPDVAARYQNKFRHVLVDEYQDTNHVQFALAQILSAGTRNLCAVGDGDQAIYAFRGATQDTLDNFTRHYPDTKVVILDQNYRSTQAILEVAQAVIDPNPAQHRAHLWTDNPAGAPVELYTAADDRDEAAWIISKIKSRLRADLTTAPSDHAVLMRTNAQSRTLEEQLTRAGIAYDIVGALKFYSRAEIKDTLSWLRIAVNPSDEIALARALTSPRRGIGEATIAKLIDQARAAGSPCGIHLRDAHAAGTIPTRARNGITSFLASLDQITEAIPLGPRAAIRTCVESTGIKDALAQMKDGSGPDRLENIAELVNAATMFTDGGTVDTEGRDVAELDGWQQTLAFLENVALVADNDNSDPGAASSRVQLLTAHAAKGMEFRHVYVPGVEENLFPHARSLDDDTALAEERRLLFVAASRAQVTLALTRAQQRLSFGKVTTNDPSRFLDDLPDTVQRIGLTRPTTRPTAAEGRPTFGRKVQQAPAVRLSGPRVNAADLSSGQQVIHTVYGTGTVDSITGDTAVITFTHSTRTLDLKIAPLRLAR